MRSPYGGFWRNEQGFTLPEVLITIILMGLVFAIATTTWQSVTQGRAVDSAANQLAADLRLAHSSATNQLTDYHLVYRSDGNPVANCAGGASADYCLVNTADSTKNTRRYLPDNARITATNLLADSSGCGDPLCITPGPGLTPPSVSGTTRTIKFDPDGSAQAMGGLEAGATTPSITVGTKNGNPGPTHQISVATATSRVKVD